MKYSIAVKFIAVVLTVVCLLATLASALGIIALISCGLYSRPLEEARDEHHYFDRYQLAENLIRRYGSLALGDYPQQFYAKYASQHRIYDIAIKDGCYDYTIYDSSGAPVESTFDEGQVYASTWEIHRETVSYRTTHYDADIVDPSVDNYYDEAQQRYVDVHYVIRHLENYTVRLYLKEDAYTATSYWTLLTVLYGIRCWLFAAFGAGLLLFVILLIYLCRAAGRTCGSDEVRPRGLSRLPLDIYTAACTVIGCFGIWLGAYLFEQILDQAPILLAFLAGLDAVILGLIFVGLIMAWAAQIKMRHHYWLKNTLVGRILCRILQAAKWILAKIAIGIGRLKTFTRQLPIILRRAGTVAALLLGIPVCIILASMSYNVGEVFWVLVMVVLIFVIFGALIYDSYAFGTLLTGAKKMASGDLDKKIDASLLRGDYYDFADELNSMSEAVAVAAQKQLRSERMKAELITNISHDIKTPLTSIINFVDLLQKPHTEEQQQEYLEVLARQSGQMKKLIEDLTELSKATTGNIAVNAQKMDAAEAINQALGEFSDKLETAGLTPVLRRPETPVYVRADGHLVWRVLFNLLSNTVKYALPGTRLYVELTESDKSVTLSLKNVSKEPLNASAEELMERFVQGDASRNTEGSGLGLNIARGLMEAQQGSLELQLDGDLFKVTLTFPSAQ